MVPLPPAPRISQPSPTLPIKQPSNAAIAAAAARQPIDILIANAGTRGVGAVFEIRCGAV